LQATGAKVGKGKESRKRISTALLEQFMEEIRETEKAKFDAIKKMHNDMVKNEAERMSLMQVLNKNIKDLVDKM